MKKLLLLFTLSLSIMSVQAQSLKILYEGEVLGDTLKVDISDYESGDKWIGYFYFRNDGGQDSVRLTFAQKTIKSQGEDILWCASGSIGGTCYATDEVSTPFYIKGDTVTNAVSFHIECTPNDNKESIYVRYTLKNVNTPSDSASVIVVFKDANDVGIRNTTVKSADINIDVYPNPANAFLNVRYTLPKSQKDGTFLLRNMIGGIVKEMPLSETTQGIKIDHLPSGVYFYSLVLNRQTITTKKLVIKH